MKHPHVKPEEMDDHIKGEAYLAAKLAGRLWNVLGEFMVQHDDRGACISVPLMAFQMLTEGYKEVMQIDPEDISSINTAEIGIDFGEISEALMIEMNEEKKKDAEPEL